MSRVSWLITDQNVTVNYEGETHIVKRSDALADRLIKAVKENRLNEIPSLVSAAKRIETFSKGAFVVQDGRVMVNGVAASEVLSNKIVRFSSEGLPFQPLLKFAENLAANPSFRAVNELYQFLEKNDHPITENGNFIAYKKVRDDFKDVHSGTFDNSVGRVVEIARNQVDEDATRTCSHGLHVANWDYAHQFYGGGVMLEVEVNPADVVAIPVDYNQSKMRVCRYKVLGVVTAPYEPTTSLRVTDPNYNTNCGGCCEGCECEEEEVDTCSECGTEVEPYQSLCEDCDVCDECGEPDCYGECEEEETDKYPYEDELD